MALVIGAVVFDVGECLVDETREYGARCARSGSAVCAVCRWLRLMSSWRALKRRQCDQAPGER